MSNGIAGVYFNDASKMLIDGKCEIFIYFERKPGDKEDLATMYSSTGYPSELNKKLTLIQHFKNHLEEKAGKKETRGVLSSKDLNQHVYVKKWLKTKHAILFRLSNKLVQVVFQDNTTIYLSTEQKMVLYLNKKKEKHCFPLATAMEEDNPEMVKRLKYTKNLLNMMLHKNKKKNDEIFENEEEENLPKSGHIENHEIRSSLILNMKKSQVPGVSRERENFESKSNAMLRLASLGRYSPEKRNGYYN